MDNLNGYELSRNWFDFCFDNPEKIKPNHTAMYFFAIEHCNRLGWKRKFGMPTAMVMEAIGIKSYNTYINTFNDLINFGFIDLIEKSKNQYSSNIIALSKFNKAHTKALDKALIKHTTKQSESTQQSIDSIIKQLTIEQLTNKQITNLKNIIFSFDSKVDKFDFKNSLLDLGIEKQIVIDWLKVRKTKKATNTQTAFINLKSQILKSGKSANECIKIAVENSWSGFNSDWIKKTNGQTNKTYIDTDQKKLSDSDYDNDPFLPPLNPSK